MGFLGSTRGLTPALDAFARTATVFERAYAQAPITTVSHATILTGTYPPFHQVDDFGAPLPASAGYLPDLLKAQGYRTGAFVGSLVLDPKNGTAPGFDRGFDVYDAGFRLRQPGEDRYRTIERRGDDVTSTSAGVAGRAAHGIRAARPAFCGCISSMRTIRTIRRAICARRSPRSRTDGEIAFVDRQVGRLIAAAATNAIIVIASDHGESLGDHGESTHGVFLYDATLRVPLIVRAAGGRGAGTRVTTRVRLADVAPTILEECGPGRAGRDAGSVAAAADRDADRPTIDPSIRRARIRAARSGGARSSPGAPIDTSTCAPHGARCTTSWTIPGRPENLAAQPRASRRRPRWRPRAVPPALGIGCRSCRPRRSRRRRTP